MKNQNKCHQKINQVGFFIVTFKLLIFNGLGMLPATATTGEPVLSVVYSQENQQQWAEITQRLQAINVKYCVIPIANVRSAADWGDRRVLFLPNVERLTSVQAIALQEWMSKGGNLIASGPVGSSSDPGVRQLMRSLLGSYWGFSLHQAQQIQPSKTQNHQWANQSKLFGQVHGGVLIPNHVTSQAAAVWNSLDNSAAVVTTERSTFLGWRWGTNTASAADLDSTWLTAALTRHRSRSSQHQAKIAGGSPHCSKSVVAAPLSPQSPVRASLQSFNLNENITKPTRVNPSPDQLDQLQQAIPWNISPNSDAPISINEAIALQAELKNLIGRVESAHLAASAYANNVGEVITHHSSRKGQVASSRTSAGVMDKQPSISQARAFINKLPQLITQKKYALARRQWLETKANLWKQFPINSRLAPAEIRAVWLDRGTIVQAGSEKELAKIFDRLAKSGINTVFLETVNAGYTIYPSQVAPKANPLIRGWDPLAAGVKLAHARGMELHAWVWVFAAGNQIHNQLINLHPDYPGPVLATNPDWANYDRQGRNIPVGQTKPFYDPANPELRQYLFKLYEEIVTRYQVDGLQLDYIRYPFQDPHAGRTYGYGKAARAQFQQLHDVDPVNISPNQRDLWQKWTAFRTEQVDSFVTQVTQRLRKQRPNLIFSVAVFPLPEIERIQKLQQNWEVWARRGDIDLIVPMTYSQDTPRFQRLAQPWIASRKLGSTLLLPGIRLLSLPNLGAFDQLQLIRDLPVIGYALFAAENFNHELEEIFTNTQGQVSLNHNQPIPHRQPFKAAAIRYAALQKEWQLGLQNDKLQMSAATVSDLNQQVKVVQGALNQLAVSPSTGNLIVARATLTRFQSQFRIWMRQQATDNLYQVQAWENRLVTIERLLRYGERRSLKMR
ncbi:glycoside hydrolase family 10 protein [Nodularia sp. UHCC 0506]|uniref:glycoside hydrolase family 10 protein n=1 Tax=Nodularia sp. UHCC 0506 TaxID=3110243 RepID=UPI002B1EAAB7|nr:family 10 glycosylhydrolase [Nodularia sp. UHCC 0506]MEA5513718.1 family 10 glycosylhydrolase [Nodularia sp. UHCC 0506]